MSHEQRVWRQGAFPAVFAVLLIWAVGFRNVSTLNYSHAVWRCGSAWSLEVRHNLPTATHLDEDNNGVFVDPQAAAAHSECLSDARQDLDVEIPAAAVVALWLVAWDRRWNRAKTLDSAERQKKSVSN